MPKQNARCGHRVGKKENMMQGKFLLDWKKNWSLFSGGRWGRSREDTHRRKVLRTYHPSSLALWGWRHQEDKIHHREGRERWKNKECAAQFTIWKSGRRSSNGLLPCQREKLQLNRSGGVGYLHREKMYEKERTQTLLGPPRRRLLSMLVGEVTTERPQEWSAEWSLSGLPRQMSKWEL